MSDMALFLLSASRSGRKAEDAVKETLALPFAGSARLLTAQERRPVWLVLTATHLRCYATDTPADADAGTAGVGLSAAELAGGRQLLKEIELDPDRVGRQLDLLPDYARRSRHQQGLYPVHVTAATDEPDGELVSIEAAERDGLLLAFDTSNEMWQWAKKIRWRGERPADLEPPPYLGIDRETTRNPHCKPTPPCLNDGI